MAIQAIFTVKGIQKHAMDGRSKALCVMVVISVASSLFLTTLDMGKPKEATVMVVAQPVQDCEGAKKTGKGHK